MRENVGRKDRVIRSVLGPGMVAVGYSRLGGKEGRPLGLLMMMAGVSVSESAITRVCPLSALFGIDSRSPAEVARDRRSRAVDSSSRKRFRAMPADSASGRRR